VDDARSTLKNVLSYMSGSRGEDAISTTSSTDVSYTPRAGPVPSTGRVTPLTNVDPRQVGGVGINDGGMRTGAPPTVEAPPTQPQLSFWQRFFACHAGAD
jgi:hypothetical protein